MSYFSDLDLQIRTFIKDDQYYRHIGRCKVCRGELSITGFLPPKTFKVVCENRQCPNYNKNLEVQYGYRDQGEQAQRPELLIQARQPKN
jgi:hypothetical protein